MCHIGALQQRGKENKAEKGKKGQDEEGSGSKKRDEEIRDKIRLENPGRSVDRSRTEANAGTVIAGSAQGPES